MYVPMHVLKLLVSRDDGPFPSKLVFCLRFLHLERCLVFNEREGEKKIETVLGISFLQFRCGDGDGGLETSIVQSNDS